MADRRKTEAYEKLRAQVEAAREAITRDRIWNLALEDAEKLVAKHKLGTHLHGWKNPYPKDDPRNLLLGHQFGVYHDRARFKATCAARQTGKDFTHSGETVEDCFTRDGTEWMVAAPSERQALDSLDQDKLWAEAFGLYIKDYKEERVGIHSETLLKSAEITFKNGSRIRAVPGRPDTVRGRSTNIRLTEFDFFENPQATWRAILPSITNPLRGGEKMVRIYSTPNGKGSALHKIMTKEGTDRMRWSKWTVTIYTAVLMGLPVDVAQLREAMDDPEGWLQEFLCVFLDGSNVLLPYELMALAESFDATEAWNFNDAGTTNPVFLGIDFGRTNDPTVCWTLQQVGDVLWTREVLVLDNIATPKQESILRDRIRAANRVCYDYTGPGIGLGDYLVANDAIGEWKPSEHKHGKLELCTFTTPFKRELFPKLRRAFQSPTRLRIPVSVAIREDLHQMQQIISNGEFNYWSPRTKGGHSDRCTALALAVRAADSPVAILTPRGTGRSAKRERSFSS
jgi:phage FluMu gp28-like protein